MRLRRWLVVAGCLWVLALSACSRDVISHSQWQRMSEHDRVLYVKSLVGAEKVKNAKGGTGKTYDRPAEDYVNEINQAYARGDQRDVPQIFGDLSR